MRNPQTGTSVTKLFMKIIYDMKLGERVDFDVWDIWRVPGGWIFSLDAGNYGLTQFVPFNSDFIG